jgi:hypothetical protein
MGESLNWQVFYASQSVMIRKVRKNAMAKKNRNSMSLRDVLMHHQMISPNILEGMRRPARAPMIMARRRILPKGWCCCVAKVGWEIGELGEELVYYFL